MDYDFDQMSRDVYLEFANQMHDVVLKNPICQSCKKKPSVRINRWGTIMAFCDDCLIKEQKEFDDYAKQEEEFRKKSDYY
jgi:hypothetical protein